jgi:hypothetical protein
MLLNFAEIVLPASIEIPFEDFLSKLVTKQKVPWLKNAFWKNYRDILK